MPETVYTTINVANDVTEEIENLALKAAEGWYPPGTTMDWMDLFDRFDGAELEDGTTLDLGEDMTTPAIKKIKSVVRAYRKQ